MKLTRPRMFIIFFAIACFPSWLLVWVFGEMFATDRVRPLMIAYAIPVLFATLIVQGPVLKQPILEPLGLSFGNKRWWLISWLMPLAVLGVAIAGCFAFGVDIVTTAEELYEKKKALLSVEHKQAFEAAVESGTPPSPWQLVLLALPAGLTLNALVAFVTEVGFRGFLFREISGTFWPRALKIGLIEGIWLAPAVFLGAIYGQPGLISVLLIVVWCMCLSPALTYVRARSQSLLPVLFFRGTLIALGPVGADLTLGLSRTLAPCYGVSAMVGFIVLWLLLFAHDQSCEQSLMRNKNQHSGVNRAEKVR